jgi:hypothetical protein
MATQEKTSAFDERLKEEKEKQKQKLNMMWVTGKPILNKKDFEFDTLTPTYDQVIAAGFRRQAPTSRDDVFNEAHGYPYFLVNFEAENFIIEWDILTHELTISVCDVLIGKISFEKAKEIIEASEPHAEN